MKQTLNTPLKLWHLIAALVVMALAYGGTAWASSSATGGGTRLVTANEINNYTFDGNPGEWQIVIQTQLNVPDGKVADLAAFFSAQTRVTTQCRIAIGVDGGTIAPGEMTLIEKDTRGISDRQNLSANGIKDNVGPGNHTINVILTSNRFEGCDLFERSLIVFAKLRAQ